MSDAYFCWLTGLIGDGYIEGNYQRLLWKLYSTDYYYDILYDRSRAADGIYLRKIFNKECHFLESNTPGIGEEKPCSVLEMMVALARKAEDDIMHDPEIGDRTSHWFWEMMLNLGLDIYDDFGYSEESVDHILYVFMHHFYASNGRSGGMFSVRKSNIDMRKTDLWMQLNVYFEENFPVPIW